MKNLLLVLGALVAVGLGALGVVILGVDLPDRGVAGDGSGPAGSPADGDVADGDWGGEDELGALDAPDPLDGSFDPLDDLGRGADPDGEASGAGEKRGGKRAGRIGGGGRDGTGGDGDDTPRPPGAPNPGGKHLDALREVLETEDPEKLRMFLVSTMSVRGTELGEAEAALLLGALGETRHAGLQGAIMLHLERIGGESVTEGLVGFLQERRPAPVVARSLQALAHINSPASISALVEAMASPKLGRNRRAAAEALARTRNPVAVAPLTATLGSSDRATRQYAVSTLARIGTTDAYEAVLDLARGGDAPDRSLARRLIEKSGARRDAFPVVSSALARERDPALRVSLARTLGRSRNADATRPLLDAARRDQAPQVRAEAVMALGRVAGRAAYADVQQIAQEDPHKGVQRAAQRTLKQIERQRR
jgi:HEAT repeat protein